MKIFRPVMAVLVLVMAVLACASEPPSITYLLPITPTITATPPAITPTPTWEWCQACADKLVTYRYEYECLRVTASEALHLRRGESEHSEALDWLVPGTQLAGISEMRGWWYVKNEATGMFGYVKGDFVENCQ